MKWTLNLGGTNSSSPVHMSPSILLSITGSKHRSRMTFRSSLKYVRICWSFRMSSRSHKKRQCNKKVHLLNQQLKVSSLHLFHPKILIFLLRWPSLFMKNPSQVSSFKKIILKMILIFQRPCEVFSAWIKKTTGLMSFVLNLCFRSWRSTVDSLFRTLNSMSISCK